MDRMKGARGEALKKAREEGTLAPRVRDVMEDELRRLKSARDGLGFIDMDAPDTFGEEYIDVMRMLEQELMDELRQQEAEMLAQYESVRQFDEAELQDSLARYAEDAGNTFVPCPICMKHGLLQNNHVIFCACGFRLDLKDPGITLGVVQQQLSDRYANHGKTCSATPTFEVQNQYGISALYLKCTVCDSLDVVI
eukprot:Phypoly_transcript_15622.p1 GENE.Phypoly_transcript_15622~~Phypoly_transcript_15622.p1  ORF type:complete len:228 (+),score=35.39 Phypoly_transcript_15622:100-684(+)